MNALPPDGDWYCLKRDADRAVYRVELAEGTRLVKTFVLGSPLARLRFARKCRRLRAVYDGLPEAVSRPALWGAGRLSAREGFLCYEWLAGRDFRHLAWEALARAERCRCLEQAARLLASLHHTGWVHGDFKFGNLLWDGESVYLLDLEGARRPLHPTAGRGRDLARLLLNGLEAQLPESDLEHFWSRYLEDYCPGAERQRLKKATRRWLRRLDRRHRRNGRPALNGLPGFL